MNSKFMRIENHCCCILTGLWYRTESLIGQCYRFRIDCSAFCRVHACSVRDGEDFFIFDLRVYLADDDVSHFLYDEGHA